MKTTFFTRASRRSVQRLIGLGLAIGCVVLPAFPLGPLAAPPWMPLAPLWAAYGWASEGDEIEKIQPWRGIGPPLALTGFGLIQDQLSGGPLGLFVIVFLAAYLIGKLSTAAMRSPNVLSLWAAFIATCVGVCVVAAFVAPWALAGPIRLGPFAWNCAITALLFPLVRPLYMEVDTV